MERLLDVLCQTESPQVVQKYCNSILNLILTQNRKKSRLIKEEFGTLIQERNSTNLKVLNCWYSDKLLTVYCNSLNLKINGTCNVLIKLCLHLKFLIKTSDPLNCLNVLVNH